ncbi:MAG TPA: helix-turn-helix transcriptional regulator [Actinomycetota bacterium]
MATGPTAPTAPDPRGVEFARWLADSLARKGLTQTEAAPRLGVSFRTLNRWIRGQSEPTFSHLRRICEVLGRPPVC